VFSWPNMGRRGRFRLDCITSRLLAGSLLTSRRGFREEAAPEEPRDRGVKNRLNFLGVIEGLRLSLLPALVSIRGDIEEEGWSGSENSSRDGGGVLLSSRDIVLNDRASGTA
jgi:hypothetical protein